MTIKFQPFDAAEYLDCPEAIAGYLEAALDSGDPTEFTAALGVVARASGTTEIARHAGLTRPALYRSLRAQAKPEFETVRRVLESLGLTLHVAVPGPVDEASRNSPETAGHRETGAMGALCR